MSRKRVLGFRRVPGVGRISVSTLLPLFLFVVPSRGTDWPQLLGPARNGVSAETGLLPNWPKVGPPLLWQKDIGIGFSGPVIAKDTAVLFHRVGDDDIVEALEPKTGTSLWQFKYPTAYQDGYGKGDGPRSTPLIDGSRVYTLGADGKLLCLGASDGKKIWERSLDEDYRARKGFFGVGTSPLVEGDLLLVNVGAKDAGIVAFDKATGKEMWKATNHEASYSSPTAATIDGVRQLLFFTRAGLVSLDPKDGAERFAKPWRARIQASVNAATPQVVDDFVFLSASYNTGALLLRIRKDGADEVWKGDDILSNHYDTSIHKDGFLYGIDGRQEESPQLRCVELKTGKVRWTRENFGCAAMIWADGNMIALTENGDLVLFEATPEAYREKARSHVLSKPCRSHPALADGRLFVRDDRKLLCFNLKKG